MYIHKQNSTRISLIALLSILGCGGPDYPTVVYPPFGTVFPNPDVVQEFTGMAFKQKEPVIFPVIDIPRSAAELQFRVVVTGKSVNQGTGLDVHIRNSDGDVVTGGGGALVSMIDGDPMSGIASFLGPDEPGEYELVIRVLDPEGEERDWHVYGTAKCRVHKANQSPASGVP